MSSILPEDATATDHARHCLDVIRETRDDLSGFVYSMQESDAIPTGTVEAFWEAVDGLYDVLKNAVAACTAVESELASIAHEKWPSTEKVLAPTWHQLACLLLWRALEVLGEPSKDKSTWDEPLEPQRLERLIELSKANRQRYTAGKLVAWISAFADGEWVPPGALVRVRAGIDEEAPRLEKAMEGGRPYIEHPGYLSSELRDMTGLTQDPLARYAGNAGVKTPGRGGRTYRYPREDARKVIEYIRDNSSDSETISNCRDALRNHFEITS